MSEKYRRYTSEQLFEIIRNGRADAAQRAKEEILRRFSEVENDRDTVKRLARERDREIATLREELAECLNR